MHEGDRSARAGFAVLVSVALLLALVELTVLVLTTLAIRSARL